jgi:hypothetical protein
VDIVIRIGPHSEDLDVVVESGELPALLVSELVVALHLPHGKVDFILLRGVGTDRE